MLIFLTLSIGLVTALTIVRLGLSGFRLVSDVSYGYGLLSGIVLLFLLLL
ncbi:MAG: hypothetical protein ACFFEK_07490 [Candidatus Thorarchaeota archaeon]